LYLQQWKYKLSLDKKLITYKLFKSNFVFENYLNDIKSFKDRKQFTKFRISAHRLLIEMGRYLKIPANERFCKFCPNKIENEQHFLLDCIKYKTIRDSLVDKINASFLNFNLLSEINKFIFLMTLEKEHIRHVANFCASAFKLREESE